MHRSSHRRWIVIITLLCQVLAATTMHMSAAHATGTQAEAVPSHCPDHARMAAHHGSGAESMPGPNSHDSASEHSTLCGSADCKCPCAHPSVMLPALSLGAPGTTHPPVLVTFSLPTPPERVTVFFRPPI